MSDFVIRVITDPSGAERGLRRTDKALNRTRNQADRLRRSIASAIGLIGAGALVRSSVSRLADFSQAMSTVSAVTGATTKQFQALTDEALRLGSTTRFTASQAAEGMLFLARAGFDAEKSLKAVGGTLQLAQAGALELGSAADIASNVLTGFRLEVGEIGRVVDVLALAANSSNTDVRQLGDAMKFVAPVAAGLGVSVEEAAAAVGALSDAGLQGSLAGTGLRRVLSELESPASNTEKILRQLGVETNEVIISQVGLTAALERLRDAGLNTGLALEIFGDRGGPAFEVLATSLPKVKGLREELGNAAGTAERIADVMDDNLNGALLSVASATEGLILQFGQLGAQNALTVFFRSLATGIRTVSENLESLLPAIGAVAAAFAVKLVRGGINLAIIAFRALNVAMLANPFGILATSIVVVGSLLLGFADDVAVSADGLVTLGDVAQGTFNFIAESLAQLGGVLGVVFSDLRDQVDKVLALISLDIMGLQDAVSDTAKGIVGLFAGAFVSIGVIFEKLPEALREKLVDGLNGLIGLFERFLNNLTEGIRLAGGALGFELPRAELGRLENIYRGAGEDLGDGLIDGFNDGFAAGVGTLEQIGINAADSIVAASNKRVLEGLGVEVPGNLRQAPSVPPLSASTRQPTPDLGEGAERLRQLQLEVEVLEQLVLRNREYADVLKLEQEVEGGLTKTQKELAAQRFEQIRLLEAQVALVEQFKLPQEELNDRQSALNTLLKTGALTAREGSIAYRELALAQSELNFQLEQATFMDGFILSLDQSLEAARNWQGEVGSIFADQFELMNVGFADAAAGAIVMGDSFSDAFGDAARQALQQFISQLIQVGVQVLINKAISQTAIAATAATQTAANAQIAATAAPAAAATSLASFGANAAPALAGISAVGAAAASLAAFQTGGEFIVGGAGGPDSQQVSFMATPGERVSIDPSGQGSRRDSVTRTGRRGGEDGNGGVVNQYFSLPNIRTEADVRRSRSSISTAAKRGLTTERTSRR